MQQLPGDREIPPTAKFSAALTGRWAHQTPDRRLRLSGHGQMRRIRELIEDLQQAAGHRRGTATAITRGLGARGPSQALSPPAAVRSRSPPDPDEEEASDDEDWTDPSGGEVSFWTGRGQYSATILAVSEWTMTRHSAPLALVSGCAELLSSRRA